MQSDRRHEVNGMYGLSTGSQLTSACAVWPRSTYDLGQHSHHQYV